MIPTNERNEVYATMRKLFALLPESAREYGERLRKRMQRIIVAGDRQAFDSIRGEVEGRLAEAVGVKVADVIMDLSDRLLGAIAKRGPNVD